MADPAALRDFSRAMQVRLLRVLQERTYEPVGSSESREADVRVIAATNRDLHAEVAAGRFREDLYYRLNVVRLTLPALAERREDIPLLVEHLVERYAKRHDRRIERVSEEALALLLRHSWPGNVRELQNALEHAFILCHGQVILPEHLPEELRVHAAKDPSPSPEHLGQTLAEVEARLIRDALRRHEGRRRDTARELGIDTSTLWRKLKRLSLSSSDRDS